MTAMRWRALCEPETLPVSSFTHSSPGEPGRARQRGLPGERGHPEAAAVDSGRAPRRARRRARPGRVGEAGRPRERGTARAARDSAGRGGLGPAGRPPPRLRHEQVIGVVAGVPARGSGTAARARRPPSRRSRDRRRGPSRRHAASAAAPLLALNSAIMASQAGTSSRSPSQKRLARARDELLDRDALLLHPGEVAEVEDALPIEWESSSRWSMAVAASARPKVSPAETASKRPPKSRAVTLAARCRTWRRRRSRR